MTSVLPISLVLVLFLCYIFPVPALDYQLPEEVAVGTSVGNVKRDSNLTSQYSAADSLRLRFHLRPAPQGQQRYFTLDERTGDISTALALDRETLCPYSLTCDLPFDVSVRPVEFYQIVKVVVHVIDINDNFPIFPKEVVTLNVPEMALPGSLFMLPAAEDGDSGVLGVQEYRLLQQGEDANSTFQLVVTEQIDGAKDVRLRLAGRLDRERVDHYRLTVVAVDGGQPPKTGTVSVDVTVLDSNDNSPQFENATYEVEINEDLAVTSTLLRVKASDPDLGPNGEVRFSLADETETTHGEIFGVDEETGDIFLKRPVDYEQHRGFLLTLQASDLGSGSLPVFAKVIVTVLDVNDNPPVITVNALTESGVAQVPENAPQGTFVAHVAVKDVDSGRNGQVQCFIDTRSVFTLEALFDAEYKITTAVSFDREVTADYDLLLTCRDRGDTSLTSSTTVHVTVLDENDNRPDLGLPLEPFEVRVPENNDPGSPVLRVNVTDKDEGRNREVDFRLQALDGNLEDLLSIDATTGSVLALKSFDYEDRNDFRFLLTVSDRGLVPLSANATLVLRVVDSNDEKPLFDRSLYFFSVRENQPPGTVVGRVNATDRDLNPDYRRMVYAFQSPNGVFDVEEQSGEVRTLRRLDREEQETYRLSVTVSNPGFSGMESTVNVTVIVDDENDSPPVFLYPGGGVDTVELAGQSAVTGAVVTRLAATDRDAAQNAELVYGVNSGNVDDLFRVDTTTGVMTLTRRPPGILPNVDLTYRLVVIVRDRGVPQLLCVADLTVIVNNSQGATGQGISGGVVVEDGGGLGSILLDGPNILILVGAALGVVIVVTCVILAAVCVRRHRRHVKASCDEGHASHRHYKSPSFSTSRGTKGGYGRGLVASDAETGTTQRSAGCGLLQHHVCECGDAMVPDDDGCIDFIPSEWSQLQQQDSGIIASSDGLPVTCGSGDVLPQQLTPSSSFSRCHGVSRAQSCSPRACCVHHCCSHGNQCGTIVGPQSSHRCRVYQSPSFRRHTSMAGPRSPSETIRMLQPSVKMLSHETNSSRDHDLESLESGSTWTDSGRGPSEEDDRLRSSQAQPGPCLNCGSNLQQTDAGAQSTVIS